MGSREEAGEEDLLGFLFGNIDEDNHVDAEYLDNDVLNHLSGLAKLQGAGLDSLQAEVGEDDTLAPDQEDAELQERAADALDFADEDELAEEDEQITAAFPPAGKLATVEAALHEGIGVSAEEEDYDIDGGTPTPGAPAPTDGARQAVFPAIPAPASVQLPTVLPIIERPETAEQQLQRAKEQGLELPILGRLPKDGAMLLAFTDFLRSVVITEEEVLPSRPRSHVLKPVAPRHSVKYVEPSDDEYILSADLRALAARGLQPRPQRGVEQPGRKQQQRSENAIELDSSAAAALVSGHRPGEMAAAASGNATPQLLMEAGSKLASAAEAGQEKTGVLVAGATEAPKTRKGPAFARLPDSIYDPIFQQSWEKNARWTVDIDDALNAEEEEDDLEGEERGVKSALDKKARHPPSTVLGRAANVGKSSPAPIGSIPLDAWDPQKRIDAEDVNDSDATYVEPLLLEATQSNEDIAELVAQAPLLRPTPARGAASSVFDMPARLLVPSWETSLSLEGGKSAVERLRHSQGLILDLNDPGLILEHTTKDQNTAFKTLLSHASATVIDPIPKSRLVPKDFKDSEGYKNNSELLELAKLNISKDDAYYGAPKRRGTGRLGRTIHHSKFATRLSTIPLQPTLAELERWHHPIGLWWPLDPLPKPAMRFSEGGVAFSTLGPPADSVLRKFQLEVDTLWDLLKKAAQKKTSLLHDASIVADVARPFFLLPGRPPRRINPDVPLMETGLATKAESKVSVVVAYQDAILVPTTIAEEVPDESNAALLRPPLAFTDKKDLAASAPGKVLLLEYLEEAPSLLNRPGMGARLTTYYRAKDASDYAWRQIRDSAINAGQRWRVGAIVKVGDVDETPFLGELQPGASQLSIETGLFTAPAHAYVPLESDFLLTRSTAGVMRVREVTGAITSGQQLPLHRIPPPGARDLKDLQERRIFVYALQTLRSEQDKIDHDRTVGKPLKSETPMVSLVETYRLFPGRPLNMIRLFLKNECGLVLAMSKEGGVKAAEKKIGKGGRQKEVLTGDEFYTLSPGARLPSEAEIRKKLSPEEACVCEAALAAEVRLRLRGIHQNQNFGFVAPEKLRLAAEMLPDDPDIQLAAKALEHALQTAPWTLTDAFISSFREGRATMRLLGPGDPTGRGAGYSFIRDIRHKGTGGGGGGEVQASSGAGAAAKPVGKLQGTDADLRKMTNDQAKIKLLGFGLNEDEIDPLGRWERINLVRELANATAADGSIDGVAKYVRHQKTTLIELQKRYRERAQEIFARQVAVLSDSAGEDLGAQGGLDEELEAELEAETGKTAGAGTEGRRKKGLQRESSPSPEEEARYMEEMRAAGLLGSDTNADGAAAAQSSQDPASAASGVDGPLIPGQTRRIRREVLQWQPSVDQTTSGGSFVKVKEVIYAGRDRPYMLASLYQSPDGAVTGPWGFGKREISFGARESGKLSYAAARGRGQGRGGRKRGRGGRGGGRGSRGGRGRPGSKHYPGKSGKRIRESLRDLSDEDEFEDDALGIDEDDETAFQAAVLVEGGRASSRQRRVTRVADDMLTFGDHDEGEEFLEDEEVEEEEEEQRELTEEEKLAMQAMEEKKKAAKAKRAAAAKLKQPRPPPPPKDETPIADQYINTDDAIRTILGEESESAGEDRSDADYNPANDDDPLMVAPPVRQQSRTTHRRTTRGSALATEFGAFPEFDLGGEEFGGVDESRQAERLRRRTQQTAFQSLAVVPPPKKARPERATKGKKRRRSLQDEDTEESEHGVEGFDVGDSYDSENGGDVYDPRFDVDLDAEDADFRPSKKSRRAAPPSKAAKATPPKMALSTSRVRYNKLGAMLVQILKELKAESDAYLKQRRVGPNSTHTYWYSFQYSLSKYYKDYYKWVGRGDDVWLDLIKDRARKGEYTSTDHFMADVNQMKTNCITYHTEGHGASYDPAVKPVVEGLVQHLKLALESKSDAIQKAAEYDAARTSMSNTVTGVANPARASSPFKSPTQAAIVQLPLGGTGDDFEWN